MVRLLVIMRGYTVALRFWGLSVPAEIREIRMRHHFLPCAMADRMPRIPALVVKYALLR